MSITGAAAPAALARLGAVLPVDPCALSDGQLIRLVEQAEDARRHAEAVGLAAAREVTRRSDASAPDSLARRMGYRTPAQAIEAITRTSGAQARKLVADTEALAKLPAVEAAVLDGRIGRDAGAAIAGELKKLTTLPGGPGGDAGAAAGNGHPGDGSAEGADGTDNGTGDAPGTTDGTAAPGTGAGLIDAGQLAEVEAHLVQLATTTTADQVRTRAHEIAAALTPEVVQAQADRAMAERYFWISPTKDGAARVKGLLPAGHAAVIRATIDAYVNPRGKTSVRFVDAETALTADPGAGDRNAATGSGTDSTGSGADGSDDTIGGSGTATGSSTAHPNRTGGAPETRTRGQKCADLLREIFAAQARAIDAPDMGGDHPTVWITTTASELDSGEGLAQYAGTDDPVPVSEAVQAACTGGTQLVVFDDTGKLLTLGREVRGFTKRQRRAIAARDGGACLIPDCTTPAQWCEVHHVVAYRDGGHTDADNGVLLCWFHHHEIDTGPWQIRMRHGTPEIRYAYAGETREWAPAGNGAAARIRAHAPTGSPPGDTPPKPPGTASRTPQTETGPSTTATGTRGTTALAAGTQQPPATERPPG